MRAFRRTISILTAVLATIVAGTTASSAELLIERDIAYVEPKNVRQSLDVYSFAEAKSAPIVFWIHGGGWRKGDKAGMERKAEVFAAAGYLFVATNYRFVPEVTIKEMTGDVAKALRWVCDNANRYGGDPARIVVMGHSAGAHLAALVCTDDRYLQTVGVPLASVKGCVPLDAGAYDVPQRLKDDAEVKDGFKETFGKTDETYRDYSPATHLAAGKHIPPFLIFYVAGREATKVQSSLFAEQLKEIGTPATVVAAQNKTHATLESELGSLDDKPTIAILAFLKASLGQK